MRAITAPARFPSRTMSLIASRTSSMFGTSPASHRRQALALLTIPDSGWLTHGRIEAVNVFSVVTRAIWASSERTYSGLLGDLLPLRLKSADE